MKEEKFLEAQKAVDDLFERYLKEIDPEYPTTPCILLEYFPKPGIEPWMAYFNMKYGYGNDPAEAMLNMVSRVHESFDKYLETGDWSPVEDDNSGE